MLMREKAGGRNERQHGDGVWPLRGQGLQESWELEGDGKKSGCACVGWGASMSKFLQFLIKQLVAEGVGGGGLEERGRGLAQLPRWGTGEAGSPACPVDVRP